MFSSHGIDPIHPLSSAIILNEWEERIHDCSDISNQREVRLLYFVNLRLVDVDMDHCCPGTEFIHFSNCSVIEPNTKGKEKVCFIEDVVG
ncbi:MAG: hypothetical protein A4E63_02602 [Syntrophorhabdus sp. PtaU1.Bin050]|nr:MAG: hypothetical protein A4E63_02602 [Syntrophorhabdus sp. PtaU1.Bin050]